MSEDNAVAEAVPSTSEPVAVDPALLNKPVMPTQSSNGSADGDDALKHKLGLANNHARAAEKRNKELESQLAQIQSELEQFKNAQTTAAEKNLERQGEY